MEQYFNLLSKKSLKELQKRKNLLAFSSGVDSSALFFLLLEADIEFDIAIVDYGVREESKEEVAYAKELAKEYDKLIFIHKVSLDHSNFEKKARDARYNFFEKIIQKHSYQNLITAHQLNDRFEWFLMQLSKGSGLVELLGFDEIEKRDKYQIIRPLLKSTKEELLGFLKERDLKYFIDKSNYDKSYKRNRFREEFSNPFIQEYKEGIKRSFLYLSKDKDELLKKCEIKKIRDLYLIKRDSQEIRVVDQILKKMGYLLSSAQRDEIQRVDELVISDRFVIAKDQHFIYIAPKCEIVMSKEFKERCRLLQIPKKIRAYLFQEKIDLGYFSSKSD